MKRRKQIMSVMLAVVMGLLSAFPSLASSEKVISSVTLRVSSKLEPDSTLPAIDFTNGGSASADDGDICVSNSSDKYSITDVEWVSSETKTMTVGYKPVLQVTLDANDTGSTSYYFKGSYKSSNVTIRGSGNFVSATRKDSDTLVVKIRVEAIEGTFSAPEDAYWKDNAKGTAKWEAPDEGGTGRYEVVLRRGSTKVHTVETSGTSYNFYPYMTQKGTYTFRVRTIAKTDSQADYGESSEWVESDEIYIAEEDVYEGSTTTASSGPGITSQYGNTNVGWIQYNGYWYYYYPDGSCQQGSWLKVDGKWYLFADDGRMLTGWQTYGNYTYYLTPDGSMLTGWIQSNGHWYYLNPTQDSLEGAVIHDHWFDIDGKSYYFASDGTMVEGWYQIDGSWYYFYPGSGAKAVSTWIGSFYVNENGVWEQ
ncbi:MAG: N-acetylmuramoyl-L-alanine amidase family protein [Clostridiales bacterium]|nr:N-acetylmuramoyl-L-alanine amidase family protein [Clostridiales bacterium]